MVYVNKKTVFEGRIQLFSKIFLQAISKWGGGKAGVRII